MLLRIDGKYSSCSRRVFLPLKVNRKTSVAVLRFTEEVVMKLNFFNLTSITDGTRRSIENNFLLKLKKYEEKKI